MPISVHNNLFSIKTKNTEYQMKVDQYGVLKHIWYGTKTNSNMEYLQEYPNIGL